MVNRKVMLAKSVGDTQPEPGYWPAKLTIGHNDKLLWHYGFDADNGVGKLEPIGNVKFILVIAMSNPPAAQDTYASTGDTNNKQPHFYYTGQKYTSLTESGEKPLALFKEWKSLVGQTVDVWIEGGG